MELIDLEGLLTQLAELQPKAQRIWEGNMREDGRTPEAQVWPTLEYGYDGDQRWHCGFRCITFIETDSRVIHIDGWALRAVRRTPAEAVQAMLGNLA